MSERMLGKEAVEQKVDLERRTIFTLEREGKFPRRRQLSPVRVWWLESEIDEWLRNRPVVGVDVPATPSPNPNKGNGTK